MPTLPAVSPPVNVEATQAGASAPVKVSRSPPSDGSATITAYSIFYGNGKNVSVPSFVTGIILSLNEDSVGETVSLRSEADQLTSQLINVTITGQLDHTACYKHLCISLSPSTHTAPSEDTTAQDVCTKCSCSCTVEVGVTVVVTILLACLVAMVILTVLLCQWR